MEVGFLRQAGRQGHKFELLFVLYVNVNAVGPCLHTLHLQDDALNYLLHLSDE